MGRFACARMEWTRLRSIAAPYAILSVLLISHFANAAKEPARVPMGSRLSVGNGVQLLLPAGVLTTTPVPGARGWWIQGLTDKGELYGAFVSVSPDARTPEQVEKEFGKSFVCRKASSGGAVSCGGARSIPDSDGKKMTVLEKLHHSRGTGVFISVRALKEQLGKSAPLDEKRLTAIVDSLVPDFSGARAPAAGKPQKQKKPAGGVRRGA